MSKQIISNYTFNATAKTITLTDFSTVRLDRLQLIVDTTTNTILYNFADSSVSTATVATNVITLSTVGSAASADKLQIVYDALSADPRYDGGQLTSANSSPVVIASDQSTLPVGGNVASGATDSGNPVKVGGKYNSTLPTLTTGQRGDFQVDSSGRQIVTLGSLLAGEDITNDVIKVENRYNATAISTLATTVIKIGAGLLQRIIVTGGTTGTIVIYDNAAASGTQIANFDTTNALAQYEFNVAFSTGLTVVTSAATKITVVWR